ncbi:hypothetical protein NML43_26830 [Rhodopseudomonas palustris]|uniref:hypothetical protein n=1 Tax=Rhodopseudomonas palustris TaxID=1076 RepID=UPI0020CBC257|nr:hypothetical protein [Rhodopseudomonas palustris]MCP9630722.1 hypothetical protein [Rhodopseudomonas palustris]
MGNDSRFGIFERLAVIAFVAGVAGVILSIAFPLAYPNSPISKEAWQRIFWTSALVFGASALFSISEITVHVVQRMIIRVGSALVVIGICLIALGSFVGFLGAFRIDRESDNSSAEQPPSKDVAHIANRTDRFGDISTLKDQQLRSLTAQFAKEMRTTEGNFEKRLAPSFDYPNMSAEEKRKEYERLQAERGELEAQKLAIFRNTLHMDMMALLRELEDRLKQKGILIPSDKPMAPFVGNLAGVAPLSRGADYLERLARMLPE